MALEGYTFDFMKVAPGMDALLYHALAGGDGVVPEYLQELQPTVSGLTATVGSGAMILRGRFIRNTTPLAVAIPANSTGYIVVTIDLTKQNSFTGTPGDDNYKPVNNQIRIERVASLTQQDLFNGGSIYHFPLIQYTSNGSTITIVNDFKLDRQARNQTVELFRGSVKPGQSGTLSTDPLKFKYLLVNITYGNSRDTIMLDFVGKHNVFPPGKSSAVDIADGVGNKYWSIQECNFEIIGRTIKMTRGKFVDSSGSVNDKWDGMYIDTVFGIS